MRWFQWLRDKWKGWREIERIRKAFPPAPFSYRFGDAATADEMAAAHAQAVTAEDVQRIVRTADAYIAKGATSAAQAQRLAALLAQLAECSCAAAKVLQQGYDATERRGRRLSRRVVLERQLGHLRAITDELYASRDVRLNEVRAWEQRRKANAIANRVTAEENGTGQ